MEILSLLQEYGGNPITLIETIFELITIVLIIMNKPKTAEQVQKAKQRKVAKLEKKNDKKYQALQTSLNQQKELEEELKK